VGAIQLCGVLQIDSVVPGRKAGEALLRLPGRENWTNPCSGPSMQQPSWEAILVRTAVWKCGSYAKTN